jgi:S1-C subfamily serine protease
MAYTDPYSQHQQSGASSGLNFWLILLCILLGSMLLKEWYYERQASTQVRAITVRGELGESEQSTIELFQASSPSVVNITSVSERLQRSYFGFDVQKIPNGTGTGFIWNDLGHVVTNFHVIQNADEAQVTLADHSVYRATFVGAEPDKDIAVLKIDAPKKLLRPLSVGISSDLQVGQRVLAIGNPFGLDQTLTTGVISGLGREIESVSRRPIQGVIQTDAAINPGNSGGPLLDSAGRLIGINTAIYSPSGSSAGIGFAVPVDTVNRIVPQIIKHGRAIKPALGIEVLSLRQGFKGVMVGSVEPGSGADDAGIQGARRDRYWRVIRGDIITEVEGQPISDQNSLYRIIDRYQIGDEVELKIIRGNETKRLKVRLKANS